MKRIAILGSTGSIGTNTLNVARHLGVEMDVVAIAARGNIELLEKQALEFRPEVIGVYDKDKAYQLQKRLPGTTVLGGMEGLQAVASCGSADMVVSAIAGTLGLVPTVAAIDAGKDIALANKEVLVSGGEMVMSLVKDKGINLVPVDSEHSAIFQCLNGEEHRAVHRIILTSSGGPFRDHTDQQLEDVSVEDALRHPTWQMGPKVTVDCSTLMNKGLEVIEAYWLFGVTKEQIDVVVHPQSIIHSMVEFVDNSLMAQMGITDMRVPIQYALTYPKRQEGSLERFDFSKCRTLEFYDPDTARFRCLTLAYDAIEEGKSYPCYMNAANEVLVNRFLDRDLGWHDITAKLESLMTHHQASAVKTLDDIRAVDQLARDEAATA